MKFVVEYVLKLYHTEILEAATEEEAKVLAAEHLADRNLLAYQDNDGGTFEIQPIEEDAE